MYSLGWFDWHASLIPFRIMWALGWIGDAAGVHCVCALAQAIVWNAKCPTKMMLLWTYFHFFHGVHMHTHIFFDGSLCFIRFLFTVFIFVVFFFLFFHSPSVVLIVDELSLSPVFFLLYLFGMPLCVLVFVSFLFHFGFVLLVLCKFRVSMCVFFHHLLPFLIFILSRELKNNGTHERNVVIPPNRLIINNKSAYGTKTTISLCVYKEIVVSVDCGTTRTKVITLAINIC